MRPMFFNSQGARLVPEPTITPTPPASVANQPSPKPVVADPKPKAKGEKPKMFVVLHSGVGPFLKGETFDSEDLYPGVDNPDPLIQRLVDLEAVGPNAE